MTSAKTKREIEELGMLIKNFYETDPDGKQLNGNIEAMVADSERITIYFHEEGEDYKMTIRNYTDYTPEQNFELWCDSAWAWETI